MGGRAGEGPARVDWLRYYSSAVVFLGVQPSEAWLLTPQEYWALYDMKSEVEHGEEETPMTREEYNNMFAELRDAGVI